VAGREFEREELEGKDPARFRGNGRYAQPDPRRIVKRKINERGIW
jgi:hypothetical protein